MSNARVDLWDAINRYVIACRGNPDEYVYGNVQRQRAVAEVEAAVAVAVQAHQGTVHSTQTKSDEVSSHKIYVDSRRSQDAKTWRWACRCGAASEWTYRDKFMASVNGERHLAKEDLRGIASKILNLLICDADMAKSPNAFKVKEILRLILGDLEYRQRACEAVAQHGDEPLDDQVPRCHVCGDEVPVNARAGLDLGAEPENVKFCEPCIEVAESVNWRATVAKTEAKMTTMVNALFAERQEPTTQRHNPKCPCQTLKSVEVDGVQYPIYLAHGDEDAVDPWAVFGSSVEGYGDTPEAAIEEWKGELRAVAPEDREGAETTSGHSPACRDWRQKRAAVGNPVRAEEDCIDPNCCWAK